MFNISQALSYTHIQDYGFDYSDNEDANESGSADVENMYYKAKCLSTPIHLYRHIYLDVWPAKKEEQPEEALKEFRAIIDQEEEKGDWCVVADLTILPPERQVCQGLQST